MINKTAGTFSCRSKCSLQSKQCAHDCSDENSCSAYQTCDQSSSTCVGKMDLECESHGDCDENWETNPLFYCDPIDNKCKYYSKVGAACTKQTCGM